MQKKFPGNIGEGISKDADVNIKKKTTRINVPFITDSPLWEFDVFCFWHVLGKNI